MDGLRAWSICLFKALYNTKYVKLRDRTILLARTVTFLRSTSLLPAMPRPLPSVLLLLLIFGVLNTMAALAQPSTPPEEGATISGTLYLPVDSTRQATTIIATLAATSVSLYAAAHDTAVFMPTGLTSNVWQTAPDSTGYTRVDVTWSSTAGVYTFRGVPPGRYRLEVTPPDRPRRTATLTITEARKYRLDFYPPGDLRQVGETMLAPIRQSN